MTDAAGAIRFALSQLGKPYLWGAVGPDSYDCSGLLQTAYRKGSGISIPRTTYDMLADTSLAPVNKNQLRPGDLVFPSTEHVQMYLGGGKVVEAPRSGVPVRVAALGTVYAARRVTTPAEGDWSTNSPVASTTPVSDTEQTKPGFGVSDISEGLGTGLVKTYSTIFQTVGSWIIWMTEALLGTALIGFGLYLIASKSLVQGMSS